MSKSISVVADSTKFELHLIIDGPDWAAITATVVGRLVLARAVPRGKTS
jgi:hypothetical protein